jgi:hypothetical protein
MSQLDNSMEHSSQTDGSRSASQDISRLLWHAKFQYRVHKSPPPDPILNNISPVHNLSLYFTKIHFNIILPTTLRFYYWFLSVQASQCCVLIPYRFLIFYTNNELRSTCKETVVTLFGVLLARGTEGSHGKAQWQ